MIASCCVDIPEILKITKRGGVKLVESSTFKSYMYGSPSYYDWTEKLLWLLIMLILIGEYFYRVA